MLRIAGFLMENAEMGATVRIRTIIGRELSGTLTTVTHRTATALARWCPNCSPSEWGRRNDLTRHLLCCCNGPKKRDHKVSLGIDYDDYIHSPIAFDYDRMMTETGYTHEEIARIQRETKVGPTPLYELKNLTKAVRSISPAGKGATILVKDEAANASGSFKARRASISAYEAAQKGFKGMIAATSGNYGAAVASQAPSAV